jgi:hypothetical protein
MMNININNIKINLITNIGSLNVGKTILTNNRAVTISTPSPQEQGSDGESTGETGIGAGESEPSFAGEYFDRKKTCEVS